MDRTYWHKQTIQEPLFSALLWGRPENKSQAGKLAVIGGNLHSFSAPAEAYSVADSAGAGLTRVLLPLSVKKLTGQLFETLEFGASNPSGSFAQASLSAWLDLAAWADGTLLAGDLGRNSETAIVFEKFLTKYQGQLTITKDAVNYALFSPAILLERKDTTLVLALSQLQKLGIQAKVLTPFTLGMDLLHFIDGLHTLTATYPLNIVIKFHEHLCVASNGQVSTTKLTKELDIWRVKTAAHAAVWWLQNPSKPFEALTTAILEI